MASAEESMKCPYESQSVATWRMHSEADRAVKDLQGGGDMHKLRIGVPIT
jgi:hypothetical protein